MSNALYTQGQKPATISEETVELVRQAMADTTRAITTGQRAGRLRAGDAGARSSSP